jgi:hypothetical protein
LFASDGVVVSEEDRVDKSFGKTDAKTDALVVL